SWRREPVVFKECGPAMRRQVKARDAGPRGKRSHVIGMGVREDEDAARGKARANQRKENLRVGEPGGAEHRIDDIDDFADTGEILDRLRLHEPKSWQVAP